MNFLGFDELGTVDPSFKICIQNDYYGCFINGEGDRNGDNLQGYKYSVIGDRVRLGKIYYDKLYLVNHNRDVREIKDINVNEFVIIDKFDQVVNPKNIKYGVKYRIAMKPNMGMMLICTKRNDFKNRPSDIFLVQHYPGSPFLKYTDKRLYWKFWPVQGESLVERQVESCYYLGLSKQSCSAAANCVDKISRYCDNTKHFGNGLCKALFYDYHRELSNVKIDNVKERQCRLMREEEDIDPGASFDYSVCKCINVKHRLTEAGKKTLKAVPSYCVDTECSRDLNKNYYKLSYMKGNQCPETVCVLRTVKVEGSRRLDVIQDCGGKDKDDRRIDYPDPEPEPEPGEDTSNTSKYLIWIGVAGGVIILILILFLLFRRRDKKTL